MLKKLFNKWNRFDKCHVCGCKETIIEREFYVGDHVLGEYDINCKECGATLNHYAYGYMQFPESRVEALNEILLYPFCKWYRKPSQILKVMLRIDKIKG